MNPVNDLLSSLGIDISEVRAQDFLEWTIKYLYDTYSDTKMKIRVIAQQELDSANVAIPNGTKGEAMQPCTLTFSTRYTNDYKLTGLDGTGLECEKVGEGEFRISGTPLRDGMMQVVVTCDYEGRLEDEPTLSRALTFTVNPDPRSLWKDLPTPTDVPFYKKDTECASVIVGAERDFPGERAKDVIAASRRGRSHANEAKPRDDDFSISHLSNGWFILAVCDGAGSAQFSRRGAELAAATVKDYCMHALQDNPAFEAEASRYVDLALNPDTTEADRAAAQDRARRAAYDIVAKAAFTAHRMVTQEAESHQLPLRDFATTLLLTVAKRYAGGWFVASFWIGDGAIALYDAPTATVKVLGTPDEGEYAGQTRFLTMTDLFRDSAGLFRRVRVEAMRDFTLLALMSDGVSDPMFETDSRLESPQVWAEFLAKLQEGFPADGIAGVTLADDAKAACGQMLQWLNFWSRGNHDDRTLVILY